MAWNKDVRTWGQRVPMLFLKDTTNLPHGPGKPDNSHQYFSLSRLEGTTVGFSMTSKIYVSFIYLEEISFKGRYTFKLLVKGNVHCFSLSCCLLVARDMQYNYYLEKKTIKEQWNTLRKSSIPRRKLEKWKKVIFNNNLEGGSQGDSSLIAQQQNHWKPTFN